jgi:hypothetical protein
MVGLGRMTGSLVFKLRAAAEAQKHHARGVNPRTLAVIPSQTLMVRGLTLAIDNAQSGKTADATLDNLPKRDRTHKLIVDGLSLAYYVVSPANREHCWDFALSGNYREYQRKVTEFIQMLQSFHINITIVFPLADGTAPISELAASRWQQKATEKLRRVSRLKVCLEKGVTTSRHLLEVLPPLMVQEIAHTAAQRSVKVLYTRNPVVRFAADHVRHGLADAVLGQDSDFMIFENINYIPIESVRREEVRTGSGVVSNLRFELYTAAKVAEILELERPSHMFQLSVLLGNHFTEPFVCNKYNVASLLKIKLNPKYPDALAVGVIA